MPIKNILIGALITLSVLTAKVNATGTLSAPADNSGNILLTEPHNSFASNTVTVTFDIDGNGSEDALTDGLLLLRYLFGFRGDTLINGAVAVGATRTSAGDLEAYLTLVKNNIGDIDGDGRQDALTDGLLLLRYLFGFRGDTLTNGAVTANASRTSSSAIEAYMASSISSSTSTPARRIVWQDEFNTIDSNNWSFEVGGQGWGNQELEYYTNGDNAAIEFDTTLNSNVLVIEARQENPGNYQCWYGRCSYTSSRMISMGKQEFTYGRMEARIKLPQTQGIWPAFWMLGNNFPTVGWPNSGEIDIMEHVGFEPKKTHGAVHGPGYSGNTPIVGTHTLQEDVDQNYHIYAIEWNQDSIRWFVDDVQFYSITKAQVEQYGNWVTDHPFFFLLNVAVGGTWPGSPNSSSTFPQRMYIDYIRVYEADSTTTTTPTPQIPQARVAIPATIQAEDYSNYYDNTPGNTGGAYRTDSVDIEITSNPGGNYNIGWVQPGEWLEYPISVANEGLFTLTIATASNVNGGTLHVDLNGTNLTGTMRVNGTGGWQSWQNITASQLNISAGEHTLRLNIDSGEFNIDTLTLSRN